MKYGIIYYNILHNDQGSGGESARLTIMVKTATHQA
ncbi:MAG: hypothetical protein DDT40_00743 [candidate division WS2 bacterium]|nr:hypothetical protein [Candidatus Psychracetigena formicireducens]